MDAHEPLAPHGNIPGSGVPPLHAPHCWCRLPWTTQVSRIEAFHESQIAAHGHRPGGRPGKGAKGGGGEGWSIHRTAKALGLSVGAVSQSLMLANAIRTCPEVLAVKAKSEALRLVKSDGLSRPRPAATGDPGAVN
jgi:hypothetical protein